MSVSRKKVIVRRFSVGLLWGYLPSNGIVQSTAPPALDLLDLSGHMAAVSLDDVKYVSYVRDFNPADVQNPERLKRKFFLARPRGEGLWIRLGLRDGDRIEGLSGMDTSLADDLMADRGIYLMPPDIRGNTQRLFVPRSAVETMQVVGVVTSPSQKKKLAFAAKEDTQPDLFNMPPGSRTQ